MALDILRAEFQKSRLLYSCHDNRVFFGSHWRLPVWALLVIRVCVGLYAVAALVHYLVFFSLLVAIEKSILVYFTTWAFVALTAHLLLAALLNALFYKQVHYEKILKLNIRSPRSASRSNKDSPTTATSPCSTSTTAFSPTPTPSALTPTSDEPIFVTSQQQNANNENGVFQGLDYTDGSEAAIIASSDSSPQNAYNNCSRVSRMVRASLESLSKYESFMGDPKYEDVPDYTRWYFQISWALSDIVMCTAPFVTCIYFVAIFPTLLSRGQGHVGIQDTNVHILNTVFAIIDFALSARPVRLLHTWVPATFGACWILFSLIYWSADEENHVIYKFFDWSEPGIALSWSLGMIGGCAFIMLLYFALYQLKIRLYSFVYDEEYYIVVDHD